MGDTGLRKYVKGHHSFIEQIFMEHLLCRCPRECVVTEVKSVDPGASLLDSNSGPAIASWSSLGHINT